MDEAFCGEEGERMYFRQEYSMCKKAMGNEIVLKAENVLVTGKA